MKDSNVSRREALALLGGAVALVACGGKKNALDGLSSTTASTAAGAPATTPPAPAPANVYPLTGMPITDQGRATRPAITVKIDNAPAARPQAGIEVADLVFEEVVEGGVVRFAVVFHSNDADVIGPVRSVRAEDAVIVTPLRGYFVYSGGSEVFNALIRKAPVGIITEDDRPQFFNRRRDRRGPFNLYTSTGTVYGMAEKRDETPPAFFTYRPAGEPLGGSAPTTDVSVTMGDRTNLSWAYDAPSNRWFRTTNGTKHLLENGTTINFPNVIIQFVRYQPTTVMDSSGAISPEAVVVGDGDAWVLSGPAMARGKWSRPDAGAVTKYADATGKPLSLLPGPTWVVLAPIGAPTVVR